MWFMRNTKPCDYPENILEDRKNEVGWKEKASPARWGMCGLEGNTQHTVRRPRKKEGRTRPGNWQRAQLALSSPSRETANSRLSEEIKFKRRAQEPPINLRNWSLTNLPPQMQSLYFKILLAQWRLSTASRTLYVFHSFVSIILV